MFPVDFLIEHECRRKFLFVNAVVRGLRAALGNGKIAQEWEVKIGSTAKGFD